MWSNETAQKLSDFMPNLQNAATAQVTTLTLRTWFNGVSDAQIDHFKTIVNSKMNDKYKLENVLATEPNLAMLAGQVDIIEDVVDQCKKRFLDAITVDDIKEEVNIQLRLRAAA